jgi:hypothetical protein
MATPVFQVIGGYAPGGWSILSDARFNKKYKGKPFRVLHSLIN